MKCPYCFNAETKVTDKRDSGESIRRRRECLKCNKRFTTYEKLEKQELYVVKKDNRRELFSKDKLKSGIMKACEKRPVSIGKVDEIVDEIERKLLNKGKEVKSREIGEAVIKKLKKLDKVAYIRFASVYREFQDLNDFKQELKKL